MAGDRKRMTDTLIEQLESLYGQGKGFKVYTTIMPGILADFNKMLNAAPAGKEVTEEYHLEDGKGVIIMSGRRTSDGQITMKSRIINRSQQQ